MTLADNQILTFFNPFGFFLCEGVLTLIFLWCKMLQLKDLEVYTVTRVIFQLAEEIPCISAVVIALLSEV